jgi:signal transduction histidine kinase
MFVTALDGVSDETKGLELGAVDFISKPIDQPIVLARVRGVLARQRLQRQLDEMQQRFSAMVVHDLRHPLAVIRGFAELARDEPAVVALPDLLSWMERILQSADRASELVSQMLDVSQLRAGRVTLKRSSLDLSRLLGQLVQDQGLLARARQLRLESAVEPGLVVDADESRLVEVLVNLIGNAMKFTPPGGRIELVAERREQDGICVSVSDTGPGIPPEHRANLFAPWEQAPNQDAAKVKGYGLGLAICRLIVQAHGGRIRIADNAGGGARFEFSLPVEQAAG